MKSKFLKWSDVEWAEVHERIRKTQRRIYETRRANEIVKMYRIQKTLINSSDAKLVAVQQVTTFNKATQSKALCRKTTKQNLVFPGVDKQYLTQHEERLQLAYSIWLNGKAQPIRRVLIDKPNSEEKKLLGISTIRDRAKQALAKLALEPEWEAVFEANSYGFRKGRCTQDAIESIFKNLCHQKPKWVWDADIRKCFDKIDHEALLKKINTFPVMEKQIKAWLQADVMIGYVESTKNYELLPSTKGTPQREIISPVLANIALHEMENHLKEYVKSLPNKFRERTLSNMDKSKAVGVVRYADDFVITHESREVLEKCREEVKRWLVTVGLEINEDKSHIKDCREGFYFLGFQIMQTFAKGRNAYKVKIVPSKSSVKSVLLKIRNVIQSNKASSAYKLIEKLVPIIRGWGNYYRYCECKDTFRKIDNDIFQKIRAWAFRRAPTLGRQKIRQKYFPIDNEHTFENRKYKNNWVLYGQSKEGKGISQTNYLIKMSWIASRNFVKVKGCASLFDGNSIYWAKRSKRFSHNSFTDYVLLKKQNNLCAYCKYNFLPDDVVERDHIIPKSKGGKNTITNLQLLHKYCHLSKRRDDTSKSKTNLKP